jgi:L-threonylcarbamoyladenylate synthase
MKKLQSDNLEISEITQVLQDGGTIVYPTETCYGLGCDASNQEAVDAVFDIKQRDKNKPLLVIAHDPSVMMRYVEWTPQLDELAEKHWPGPLTIVARAKEDCGLAKGVIAEDNTIAFRITAHHLASELCEALDKPLVSTSANIASQDNPYDIEHVEAMFTKTEKQPDILIDAGELPHQTPSTIIKIHNGEIEVIRQGQIII